MTAPNQQKTKEIMVSLAVPDCELRAVNRNAKTRRQTLPTSSCCPIANSRVSWVLFHTGEEF